MKKEVFMKYGRKSLALLVAWGLLATQANFAQTTSQPPQAAQQSQEQLQQLVAPIALYPGKGVSIEDMCTWMRTR